MTAPAAPPAGPVRASVTTTLPAGLLDAIEVYRTADVVRVRCKRCGRRLCQARCLSLGGLLAAVLRHGDGVACAEARPAGA